MSSCRTKRITSVTVVDGGSVIATHLNHLITAYALELMGRTEVQALLDLLVKDAPELVEELVPNVVSLLTCPGH